ncbi:MAG: phosphatidate cytidylyltransferase [Candidatus Gastranaerophilales bacterium]|nr:phosphatidate cytidylyltransferase [Candidatus Gastranaerophilales bacterium]MCM1072553.1 phosphatidate cytidylyltransferase [Bacteroides sp.]
MGSKRLATGTVIGLTALFALMQGGIWLALLVSIVVFYASKEYTTILRHKGFFPSLKIILASSLIFAVLAFFNKFEWLPLAFTLSAMMALMWVLFRGRQPYIANVATTVFGFLYCGWFPLHLLFLRNFEGGMGYTVLLFFAVLVTDTFCYIFGSRFGKHKLAAVISPNKTIEGSIGGSVMCMIFSLAIGIPIGLPWYHAVILGVLIAAFAQIGDLCESMIKRDAGVKDSSNVLPGHGGFLDRTDSYILTIPVVYYYLEFFRGLF